MKAMMPDTFSIPMVYKQHFSLASGQCLEDPDVRVAVFPARTEGDTVLVQA